MSGYNPLSQDGSPDLRSEPGSSPVASLVDVHRSFGETRAIGGVSLSVGPGEVVGLLGHNGAGKTTAVRLLTGILAPNRGTVRVHGLDPVIDGREVRRRTGVVSAVPAVDDRLTARQNLTFVTEVFGLDRQVAADRAADLLERFGLGGRPDEQVGGYSSGMRQRLALARALLTDPPLLLLDEPTAALDPVASRDVREVLDGLARGRARSVLLCSHNLVEVQQLCDRVVVLEHGRVIADGAPASLAAQLGIGRLRIDVEPSHRDRAEQVLREAGAVIEARMPGRLLATGLGAVDVPTLVADLVRAEVRLHAFTPEEASLEDVYFALHDGDGR